MIETLNFESTKNIHTISFMKNNLDYAFEITFMLQDTKIFPENAISLMQLGIMLELQMI